MAIDLTTIPALAGVEPVRSTKTPLHLDYRTANQAQISRYWKGYGPPIATPLASPTSNCSSEIVFGP